MCGQEVSPLPLVVCPLLLCRRVGCMALQLEHSRKVLDSMAEGLENTDGAVGVDGDSSPLPSLPLSPFQVSPDISRNHSCVSSVHIGEEEEEEKGQAAWRDQW